MYLLSSLGRKLLEHLLLEPAHHDGAGEQPVQLLMIAGSCTQHRQRVKIIKSCRERLI